MNRAPGAAQRHADEIVYRYEGGQSIRTIAAALWLSYSGVHRVLEVAGVRFRPVGRRRTEPSDGAKGGQA